MDRSSTLVGLRRLLVNAFGVARYSDVRTFLRYALAIGLNAPEIARTKGLEPADRRMHGRICHFRPLKGREIVLNGDFFAGARELYCRRVYFSVPGFEIRDNDTVVDLGANVGLFTTMAARYGGRVVAVEAQSEFIPIIEANLAMNGLRDAAIVVHGWVGSESGALRIPEVRNAASHWNSEPPLVSVTDLIQQFDLDRIDFLKIDIEGSEFALFERDRSFLDGVSRISMEVHPSYGDARALRHRLLSAGFAVTIVHNDGSIADDVEELIDGWGGYGGGYYFCERRRDRIDAKKSIM